MNRLAAIAARDPDTIGEAEQWLRSAAQLGDVRATHKLGVMLWRRGEHEAGEALIHRAALQRYQDSIAAMAELCEMRGDAEAAGVWSAQMRDPKEP